MRAAVFLVSQAVLLINLSDLCAGQTWKKVRDDRVHFEEDDDNQPDKRFNGIHRQNGNQRHFGDAGRDPWNPPSDERKNPWDPPSDDRKNPWDPPSDDRKNPWDPPSDERKNPWDPPSDERTDPWNPPSSGRRNPWNPIGRRPGERKNSWDRPPGGLNPWSPPRRGDSTTIRPTRTVTTSTTTTTPQSTTRRQTEVERECQSRCFTSPEYNPVCGSDSVTYSNPGRLKCTASCGRPDLLVAYYGTCRPTGPPLPFPRRDR